MTRLSILPYTLLELDDESTCCCAVEQPHFYFCCPAADQERGTDRVFNKGDVLYTAERMIEVCRTLVLHPYTRWYLIYGHVIEAPSEGTTSEDWQALYG